MATTLYTRSYNPIWDFRSLTGLPLDDTSWAYFLENEIPYLPQTVYQNENGTPWPSPVQLSAAGTLQNIFFDPTKVYRIEIRTNLDNLTPPTQADPLVWLIEDYVPSGGGINPPITSGNIASSNQITNPQFAFTNFVSPLTLNNQSTQTISVGDGWDLVLTGSTANVTLTKLPLNSASPNPTNAPYALQATLTGWTSAYLRQRFEQNGLLWSGKNVTASVTARINGSPQVITGTLVDSLGELRSTVLTATVTANYEQFAQNALLGASVDTDLPPDAYLEYRINLPGSCDISITSIQILATNNAVALTYEEDTVNRQIDHTFNVYKESILQQPKESILVGWDFPLNPWQFYPTSATPLSGSSAYIADQTIVVSENASSVETGKTSQGYLEIGNSVGQPQGKFAVIQYIDPSTMAANWNSTLSVLARMAISTGVNTQVSVKIKLIYSSTLPSGIDPIASWGAIDPVFTAQWTELSCINDPAYLLTDTITDFSYNAFVTPDMDILSGTATLGIVVYTTSPLSEANPDAVLFKSISLVKNDYAIESPPLTFDETLRRCEFYYEKSYENGTLPGAVNFNEGQISSPCVPVVMGFGPQKFRLYRQPFSIFYKTIKRTFPDLTIYSPSTGAAATVDVDWWLGNTAQGGSLQPLSNYILIANSDKCATYNSNNDVEIFSDTIYDAGLYGTTTIHYVADARLGLVV